jgi:uncharacterized protein (TIGR03086 family)
VDLDRQRFVRSIEAFGEVVATVGDPDAWDLPSPCAEWSAGDVVGHVVAIEHAIAATIAGQPAPMNPMVRPRRHAGDDPGASWRAAADLVLSAISTADVLGRVVTTWRGETTVASMLAYNVGDITVHTWDLARAVGADAELDPTLVEAALALYEPIADTMRGPQVFGTAVVVDPSATAQDRLLALVGRHADWTPTSARS